MFSKPPWLQIYIRMFHPELAGANSSTVIGSPRHKEVSKHELRGERLPRLAQVNKVVMQCEEDASRSEAKARLLSRM